MWHAVLHLVQAALQGGVACDNGDLRLEVAVHRAEAKVGRADQRHARPRIAGPIPPQPWHMSPRDAVRRATFAVERPAGPPPLVHGNVAAPAPLALPQKLLLDVRVRGRHVAHDAWLRHRRAWNAQSRTAGAKESVGLRRGGQDGGGGGRAEQGRLVVRSEIEVSAGQPQLRARLHGAQQCCATSATRDHAPNTPSMACSSCWMPTGPICRRHPLIHHRRTHLQQRIDSRVTGRGRGQRGRPAQQLPHPLAKHAPIGSTLV